MNKQMARLKEKKKEKKKRTQNCPVLRGSVKGNLLILAINVKSCDQKIKIKKRALIRYFGQFKH